VKVLGEKGCFLLVGRRGDRGEDWVGKEVSCEEAWWLMFLLLFDSDVGRYWLFH
jgi:hypothetical protein